MPAAAAAIRNGRSSSPIAAAPSAGHQNANNNRIKWPEGRDQRRSRNDAVRCPPSSTGPARALSAPSRQLSKGLNPEPPA